MAFVRGSQEDDEEQTNSVSQVLGGTTAGGSAQGGTGTTANPSNPDSGDSYLDPTKIAEQNADAGVGNLLNGLYGKRDAAKQAFTGAQSDFNSKLGVVPAFGQTEQTSLKGYLDTGQGKETAEGFINNKYEGPQADFFDTDSRANTWSTFGQTVGNLGSTSGLQNYLQTVNPNSNQGERRFDALLYGKNKDFQDASKTLANDWSSLEGQIGGAKTQAQTAVADRTKGAQNVQTASRDYVGNYRSDIGNQVQSRLSNELNYLSNPQHEAGSYTDITGVNPSAYRRNLQTNALPTFAGMLSGDDAGRYNRAGGLLGYDEVAPTSYARPQVFNEDALLSALQAVERRYGGGSFASFMDEGGRAQSQRDARAAGYTGAFGDDGYNNYAAGYATPTGQIRTDLLGGQHTDPNTVSADVLAQRLAARNSGYTGDFGAGGYGDYSRGYANNEGAIRTDLLGGQHTDPNTISDDTLAARKEARDRGYTGAFGGGGYSQWAAANGY